MISETLQKARDYEEKYGALIPQTARPVYHFSSRVGWMNDPNGFSLYKGQYHLFYQYHPYTNSWGPMHWGHAVSRDLLHWEYRPAAIAPDTDADHAGCFSGSALELPDGRQLLLYTGVQRKEDEKGVLRDLQVQCVAVGDGENYEKSSANPVLDGKDVPEGFSIYDFRDPRIFTNPDGSYGCMVGNRADDGSGALLLYRSEDAVQWTYQGILDRCNNEYGRMWECPDFFPLDGHHVIVVSPQEMQARELEFHNGDNTMAIIGTMENGTFRREAVQAIDHGLDFYAPQTLCTEDGRRVMIGWMQGWATAGCQPKGAKWFGQMTTPREITIRNGRLYQNPVRELDALHGNGVVHKDIPLHGEMSLPGVQGRVLDMTVTIRPEAGGSYGKFRIQLAGDGQHHCDISYDPNEATLRFSRVHSGTSHDCVNERQCPAEAKDGVLKLRILLDRFSAEIFINDGERALTATFYTPQTAEDIRFACDGNAVMTVEKYDISMEK